MTPDGPPRRVHGGPPVREPLEAIPTRAGGAGADRPESSPHAQCLGAAIYVYDHGSRELSSRLTRAAHEQPRPVARHAARASRSRQLHGGDRAARRSGRRPPLRGSVIASVACATAAWCWCPSKSILKFTRTAPRFGAPQAPAVRRADACRKCSPGPGKSALPLHHRLRCRASWVTVDAVLRKRHAPSVVGWVGWHGWHRSRVPSPTSCSASTASSVRRARSTGRLQRFSGRCAECAAVAGLA